MGCHAVAAAAAPDGGRWLIRHGAGVTRYQHAVDGVTQELAVFVAAADPVKLAMLTLTNTSATRRRFSIFGYAEWRLGPPRSGEHRFVVTDVDPAMGAILATNTYNSDFAGALSFYRATLPPQSYTADRIEFVGRNRSLTAPAALFREGLEGRRWLLSSGRLSSHMQLQPRPRKMAQKQQVDPGIRPNRQRRV